MSRLNDLLRQLRMEKPELADDLQREYDALADRRSFGLNFERHVPEAVELPGRKVRKGDKVRVLPPRGETRTKENDRLWRVVGTATEDTVRQAQLVSIDDAVETSVVVDDLIVVAEFRDPIYPGLVPTGKVERAGDKPYHAVINAENYHALQTLLFTHRGMVDCIYIDPPYNTGAKDWKYNNDYVEGDDLYRHSKWLAFMERRLLLAKELLNPDDSVLIVTIDEREYLRLGLLLEAVFPDARIQMVSSVINPKTSSRSGLFGRSDEYIFFVMLGNSSPKPLALGNEWKVVVDKRTQTLRWAELQRYGKNGTRVARPNLFYPIFVAVDGSCIHSVGFPPAIGVDRDSISAPDGTVAIWPIHSDGVEGSWGVGRDTFLDIQSKGYVRLGSFTKFGMAITRIQEGEQRKVESGVFTVTGRRADGSIEIDATGYEPIFVPGTQWRIPSHDAGSGGSNVLKSLLPQRSFPFPKSLYAVEDALRFFVGAKPDALVLDFFAGSGTTLHAVARLNRQDGGGRRSIVVTNNEVSSDEQKALRDAGLRPGDSNWEQHGICEFITKPRVEAAISGCTPAGDPVKGDYKFNDEFPMADGLAENVEFFTLTYEAPLRVASNREFERIAPLLWLRAGARGRRIDDVSAGWDVADVYGVISDLDRTEPFLKAIAERDQVGMAFIVTDEDRLFESLVAELPDHVEPVRLYEAYLRNFEIEAGRGTR